MYKHIKTGRLYLTTQHKVINATNAVDGQIMVSYIYAEPKPSEKGSTFVRERKEFYEKFEKM